MLTVFIDYLRTLWKVENVHIDNNVFKLHYRFTVVLLLVFSILLTSKQYFGDPIDCDVEGGRKDFMDTYCWIYGTYVVKNTLQDKLLPGLGNEANKDVVWQMYYQWVSIILCFQALLFYLPRYLWTTWEGGRIKMLIKDLGGPLVTSTCSSSAKDKLIAYIVCGKYSHAMYGFRYSICEILNFINTAFQLFLMDWLISGEFSLQEIASTALQGIPAMHKIFPKLTKCRFVKYGPSGNYEMHDTVCVLPLNILNEKLFLILWFWLLILCTISFLALLYRSLVYFVPKARMYLLMAQIRYLGVKQAKAVVEKLSYGDFFVLYHIGKNVNPLLYKEIVVGIRNFCAGKTSLNTYAALIDV